MFNNVDTETINHYIRYIEGLKEKGFAIIYISGPISIFHNDVYGSGRFKKYYEKLRDFIKDGGTFKNDVKPFNELHESYYIINPPEINMSLTEMKNMDWGDFMAYDFMILNHCTHIFMLPMWEKSSGAIMEREFAEKSGKITILETDKIQIDEEREFFKVVKPNNAFILKKLGYDIPCRSFYVNTDDLKYTTGTELYTMGKPRNHNEFESLASAPSLSDVHKWLMACHGIDINIICSWKNDKPYYRFEVFHNKKFSYEICNSQNETYEDALAEAIQEIIVDLKPKE